MTPPLRTVRSSVLTGPSHAAVVGAIVALVTCLTLLAPSSALAITRDTVLARAQKWVDSPVPYSQAKSFGGYRTDCSGYVSMAWQTGFAYDTASMRNVATKITTAQLKPGDVMLRAKTASRTGHVRLFYGWVDETHTTYIAYEQTGPSTRSSVKSIAADLNDAYLPYRYKKITDSPAPWSATINPVFNVWADGRPAWWTLASSGGGLTGYQVRSDSVASKAFALGLSNYAPTSATYIDARQTVPVEAGKTYLLQAFAATTSSPSSVKLRIQLHSAGGLILLDQSTTGDAWGVGAGAPKPMAVSVVVPAGVTHATTSVRLTGSTNASGTVGGMASFDDVRLFVTSPLPIYRFYNRKNGSHFYTATGSERDVVANTLTSVYTYEGPAYGVPATPGNGSRPVPLLQPQERHALLHRLDRRARSREVDALWHVHLRGPRLQGEHRERPGRHARVSLLPQEVRHALLHCLEAERDNVRAKLSATYTYEGPAFYIAP